MEIGQRIDELYQLRATRLKLEKEVEALKQRETGMQQDIIHELQDSKLRGAKGLTATAALQHKTKPNVVDWDALYDYIYENKNFALLHKRLTEGLWAEMTADGIELPGVESKSITTLSLTKGS